MSDSSLTTPHSKVYIEILRHIRTIIADKQLSYGDKIPSERELAENLKVGRSSVREALRALELLGMIETRRGEGTFLKDFREHNLIELLGTFILDDTKAIKDVIKMNELLEKNALQLILQSDINEQLVELSSIVQETEITRFELMTELVKLANNFLLYRIWNVLNEYVNFVYKGDQSHSFPKKHLEMLLDALIKKDHLEVFIQYEAVSLKENVE
ncbi:FadR/GntR family transcriptional regulator [Metabacillus litoralis]|uniref:FadR/GntR family transcriptional regulator n=2 Tax=Metabacillus litoralis TaxID=152268 RepID=UPI0020403503|nr:GntR family transcriptional regulator [Metabacillus litoralis]MCM3162850.1 GntR family transcriptional regulator [Metabacillus litoralis]MCM3411016.1 GntR family transcriptional regulator [Metabacillus litoralis]